MRVKSNTMKLTINHLKGYAGTGLKVSIQSELYPNPEFIGYVRDVIYLNYHGSGLSMNIDKIKPLLHPLSSLTKYREDLGFVPIERLEDLFPNFDFYNDDELSILFSETTCNGTITNTVELMLVIQIIEKLNEWHIDYQNLIKENLAIEIN